MRALIVCSLFTLACGPEVPRLEEHAPVSLEVQGEATVWPYDIVTAGWRPGTAWMVKERCATRWDYALDGLGLPETGPLYDWPAHRYYRIESVTPREIVLYTRLLNAAGAALQQGEPNDETWTIIDPAPFRVVAWRYAAAESAQYQTLRRDKPNSVDRCNSRRDHRTWCWARLPAELPSHDLLVHFPYHQHVFENEDGATFIYGNDRRNPTGGGLYAYSWRRGEPYWEDSLGCGVLVRDNAGKVYQPTTPEDRGPAEPMIATLSRAEAAPGVAPSPAPAPLPARAPFEPPWRTGDRWITRNLCVPAQRSSGPLELRVPPPLPRPARPTYAAYEVREVKSDSFTLQELKLTLGPWDDDRLHAPNVSKFQLTTYKLRRRPFGIQHWFDPALPETILEHRGGPCLNTEPRTNRCPFPMPAEPPPEGATASWSAKQTVRSGANGVDFEYDRPDGSHVSMTWVRGEPFPEVVGSCLRLVREPDGSVFRPNGGTDLLSGETLERWAEVREHEARKQARSNETEVEP